MKCQLNVLGEAKRTREDEERPRQPQRGIESLWMEEIQDIDAKCIKRGNESDD